MYRIGKNTTMKQAYKEYEKYLISLKCGDDSITFDNFVKKLEYDDDFFNKYGKNCATIMSENERIKEWCDSIGKDISYGESMTHKKLDSLRFKKYRIV